MNNCKVASMFVAISLMVGSVAMAIEVDFDRAVVGMGNRGFIHTARDISDIALQPQRTVCVTDGVYPSNVTSMHKLSSSGTEKLRKEILGMRGVSPEILSVFLEKGTQVLFDDKAAYLVVPRGEDYSMLHESTDEYILEFLKNNRVEVQQAKRYNKSGSLLIRCRPVIRLIWKWVKEAWVAYEITEEICEEVAAGGAPSTENTQDTWPGSGPGALPPGNPYEYRGTVK